MPDTMTAADHRTTAREKDVLRLYTDMARHLGWTTHHETNSFGTAPGWPDLACFHPERGVAYLEIKTKRGRVTPAQWTWIATMRAAGQRAYIVTIDDFPLVEALFSGLLTDLDFEELSMNQEPPQGERRRALGV